MRNPLGRINNATSPGPIMFWPEVWVGEILDACFRIGGVLAGRVSGRARYNSSRNTNESIRARSTCQAPDRPQNEPFRSEQLDQRGLKEAFTPGAANGQLFVEWLPAHPHLGYECIRIIILKHLVAVPARDLQRVEPRDAHFRTEDWNEYFRIKRVLFAPSPNRGQRADTSVLSKAVLVIRIDDVLFPAKRAANGESNATAG